MTQTCELVTREAMPSVIIRTRCSVEELPNIIGTTYQRIAAHLGSKQLTPSGPPYVGYHNEDMQDLDLEIGFPVAEVLGGEGEFEASSIPSGQYATTMHIGPYAKFEESYNRLTQWLESQSLEPTGSCYEVYLNDPVDTPEEALQTLILFPLK
jgi:effector-binding domain-containing protein